MTTKIPYISNYYSTKTLMVDDKPWFCFGGEVHNSSASSVEYFKKHVLDEIDKLNLNTLLIPVYWEQIEPKENEFNFDILDEIINLSREKGIRLILLWFGLWKNGISTYVPEWVKEDRYSYPFVKKSDKSSIYSITPLCGNAVEKDSNAFYELMLHIKEFDQNHKTVIMMQVENEIGSLETDRDYSDVANKVFLSNIPEDLSNLINKSGTWEECFDKEASEVFMCYHYAKAVEKIAQKGKSVYNLPMIVNAWLKKPNENPGKYPSGGPVQERIALWKTLAPSIDLCSPDIYVDNYKEICDIYSSYNPLLVPETRQDVATISHVIHTFANYPSLGFSPFGIEDFLPINQENYAQNNFLKLLGISRDAFNPEGTTPYLSTLYKQLLNMQEYVLTKRGSDNIYAFMQEKDEKEELFKLSNLDLKVTYLRAKDNEPKGAGFVIKDNNELYIYGMQFILEIKSINELEKLGVLAFEEGHFEGTKWICDRVLNGDERYVIILGSMSKCLRLKWHMYK